MAMRPGILARRDELARARADRERDRAQPIREQQQIQVGACGGCGGMIGGCSCNTVGMTGIAAIPWTRGLSMIRGMFPEGYEQQEAGAKLASTLQARFGSVPEPHSDEKWDYTCMDLLYSAPVTLLAGPGVVTDIEVEPQAGCFFAFYWRIIVRDPTTGVAAIDWQFRRPRVEGCPIACDDLDRNIASQFAPVADPLDQRCCGMPIKAFLQRPSEDLPLVVPVVNNTAAALEGQVEVRGFCCSTRIC